MPEPLQTLAAIQGVLTAVSGGFNALHFATHLASQPFRYRKGQPARRIAALVLSLVNLSFFLQGIYWTLLPFLSAAHDSAQLLKSGPLLMVGLVTLASSLAITALVLRQRFNGGQRD